MARGRCGAVHSLLFLLLLPLSVAEERQCWHHQDTGGVAEDMRCLNTYGSQRRHVVCDWKQRHNQSLGEGPFYLKFSHFLNRFSSLLCPLSASPEAHGHYSCAAEGDGEFIQFDKYKVSLYAADTSSGKNMVYPVFEVYEPSMHIQCDAPTSLQSRINASKCLIQWKKPEAYEDLLQDWHWHLAFKIVKEPWQQAKNKSFISQESWVEIDGSEFVHGMDYTARIRCKIPDENTNYCSQWSPWSITTRWTAPPGDEQKLPDPLPPGALLASLPLCLGALLFLLLALKLLCRMMDKERAHTLTPATFFQPLYTSHNGDFKGWAGLTGKTVCLGSNTEEDEDTAMPSWRQEGKGHALGVPSSQITFCPVGVKPVALRAEHTQGPQSSSGRQGKGPLLFPWGASLWEPGQTQNEKAAPPSFLELGPCRETEALFSCSNDYYCTWGGSSSSSKPGTLMNVSAGKPQGVKESGHPGVALAQGPPSQV